jgi:hypothetical protein
MKLIEQSFNVSHRMRKRKKEEKKTSMYLEYIWKRKDKLNVIHLEHIHRPSTQPLYILQGVQIE